MDWQDIRARQQAILAELASLTDQVAEEGPHGDLVDELLDEYGRLQTARSSLQRLRVMTATRPGLRVRPGREARSEPS